jgi:hypothetical protein
MTLAIHKLANPIKGPFKIIDVQQLHINGNVLRAFTVVWSIFGLSDSFDLKSLWSVRRTFR